MPLRFARKPLRRRRRPTGARRGLKRATYRNPMVASAVAITRPVIDKRKFLKMIYESGDIGDTTTIAMSINQFRLNSIFDPDLTSTGHQPRGRDQLSALYNNYLVYGCRVDIFGSVSSGQAGAANGAVVIYPHTTDSVFPLNLTGAYELADATVKTINFATPFHMTRYISCPKTFGVSKERYRTATGFTSGQGGNPITGAVINIQWINLDESTSTTFTLRVKLTYDVELFDPVKLGES